MTEAQQANGLFDSLGRRNRTLADKLCPHCGKKFRPSRTSSKYCSRPCMWANNGQSNKRTGSSWINQKGYIEERIWLDDGSRWQGKQHRLVMEKHLGRKLLPEEDVHHIDGNKRNNAIENLKVISHGAHTRLHNKTRKYKRGYRLKISEEERNLRSQRAKAQGLSKAGHLAISKARGKS